MIRRRRKPTVAPRQLTPNEVIRELMGVKLTPGQEELVKAIFRHRRVAIKGCHASGKTFAIACAVIAFCLIYKDDCIVLLTAPGWGVVRNVLWGTINQILDNMQWDIAPQNRTQTQIRLSAHAMIVGLSASDPVRMQGFHARHVLIVVDEAVGLDDEFWPALQGVMAGGDAHVVVSSNPTKPSGPFFDIFHRSNSIWERYTIKYSDTPNFQGYTLDQILHMTPAQLADNPYPKLITRQYVYDMFHEWGSSGSEWRMRIEGEFPTTRSEALIPLEWLEKALPNPGDPGGPVVAAIDVAGPGKDRTVAVVCCNGVILAVKDFDEPVDRVREAVQEWLRPWLDRRRLNRIHIDAIGMGEFWEADFKKAGFPMARGIKASCAPDERYHDTYINLKAQRYFFLRKAFETGYIHNLGIVPQFLEELQLIEFNTERGRKGIEDKAAIRSKLGRSPDYAEALMLAQGEESPEQRLEGLDLDFMNRANNPSTRDRATFSRQHFASMTARISRKFGGW